MTKDKSTRESRENKEENKATLAVGDPEASYVAPDLSAATEHGELPESEQEWNDERDDAQEDSVETAAEHEDKVARERREKEEKEAESRAKGTERKLAEKPADRPVPTQGGAGRQSGTTQSGTSRQSS